MTKHTNPTIFYGRMAKKKNDRMKWKKNCAHMHTMGGMEENQKKNRPEPEADKR